MFEALPHMGRSGFKHCGLEIEVLDPSSAVAEDVAGAIVAMAHEHAESGTGQGRYRIDALTENSDRLAEVVLRMSEDGELDDVGDTSNAAMGRWALQALKDEHARHMQTLDKLPALVQMVGECLDAMAGAVAAAAEARMSTAAQEAEREAAQHSHEKQMGFLNFLATEVRAKRATEAGSSPVRDLLATMPAEVKSAVRGVFGTELWSDFMDAVMESSPGQRALQFGAVLERVTPAMREALGRAVPPEWQSQLLAALQHEMRPPQSPPG